MSVEPVHYHDRGDSSSAQSLGSLTEFLKSKYGWCWLNSLVKQMKLADRFILYLFSFIRTCHLCIIVTTYGYILKHEFIWSSTIITPIFKSPTYDLKCQNLYQWYRIFNCFQSKSRTSFRSQTQSFTTHNHLKYFFFSLIRWSILNNKP